jgi:4-amino-4-deoxy-L-arabinose transferase-like glycosyltransferase
MVSVTADPVPGLDSRHRRRSRAHVRRVFHSIVQSRPVAWAVFTVLYAIPTVYLAHLKLFWDDEFFTLYLSRTPTWHDLLQALATGADQHPPSFYYLTHLMTTVFGSGHVTVRLPAILGFWLLCICLYEIVRDLATPEWAVVAMFFPLSTGFYYYASEARGYGLVCGFAGLAMLSWMRAAGHRNRMVYVPLLAVSLAAAVASHYYAGLVVVALALGELVRTRHTKKIDWPIWIAFTGTCVPILAFLGTIRSARGYSSHFWAIPVWSDAIAFYPNQFGLGAFAVLGTLAIALSFRVIRGKRIDQSAAIWRKPSWSPWQAVAVCTLAALPVPTMLLAKFVTHGFTPRYCIFAIVGVTVLLFYFISRFALRRSTATIGLVACVLIFLLQVRQLNSTYKASRGELDEDVAALSSLPDAPIVVMEVSVAHRLSYYAPRRLASRLVYVADANSSISYLGQDTVDRGLLDLRSWFPIDIVRADSFLTDNSQFYVFGQSSSWSWLTFDMAKWGETKLLARREESRLLFSVDHVRVSADPAAVQQQRILQSKMLFATLPREGPSLCVVSMGLRSCPASR